MKPSRYNYTVPFGKKTIFYNGLTEQFFIVKTEHKETYLDILQSPEIYIDKIQPFLNKMKKSGFIINDDADELAYVRDKLESQRMPHQYFLLVLPTYQCNLRCWYCIQNHENMFMTDETLGKVKNLIVRKLEDPEITELYLSWFGGEPLMAYDKVLELTLFARDYCLEHGKSFSCGITTNGTLLSPSRIEALHKAGVNNYQITIDGDRETHNSVKKLGNELAYETTVNNINLIARHSFVSLRFNYTRDNLKPERIIQSLMSVLDPEVTDHISFSLFKVWQENQELVPDSEVDKLFTLGKEVGMYSSLSNPGLCYTDRVHYDCVFPNGRIGKCDNHNPNDMPGILQNDGTIHWEEDMKELYAIHIFDYKQSECIECRYLPICWGPCVAKREVMLRNEGKIKCFHLNKDRQMEWIILNHCKTQLQNSECQISNIDK